MFQYPCEPPAMFQLQGDDRRFETWEREIKAKLNPSVKCVIFILSGNKNGAPMYDPIKKLLLESIPVPSQVVLQNTIKRGKNLFSIVNKILIQINAKCGGEPWAVSDMPFSDAPTMVVGYDVHHKKGSQSYLAINATVNKNFNKYWSAHLMQGKGDYQEISDKLQTKMVEAMNAFKAQNGIYPKRVIFFRDGVGESQKDAIM